MNKPEIPEDIKAKFKELKQKLDKFKKEVLKKFDKYIIGMALLPPIKEEYLKELSKEEQLKEKNAIRTLILVDDTEKTKTPKYELKRKISDIIEKIAKETDKNIKPETMLLSELTEACYDAKYEILEDIAMSAIIHDPKDLLQALKITQVHKTMVIKKFEKYVVSYVAVGSLFRGDAKSNDIDVAIVIDDTDVKKMPRLELKDKLRAIIYSMGDEASRLTGVKKQFHIQTYILTDFWDSIKDASPVIFTFLRDGVPVYDRGVFMPWKLLLKMGRIKPSQEAIDMNMDIGERLIQRTKGKLLSIIGEDLFYATMNPAQAALMLYGLPPPTPKETVKLMEDIFVKKEKLLKKQYVDTLEKVRQHFKDVEHGKLKSISGTEIDRLLKEVEDYLKAIKNLFDKIQKRTEKQAVKELYETCMQITNDILKQEKIKSKGIKGFKELIEKGKFPKNFLDILKIVIKAKKDYDNKKLTKHEINKVQRQSAMFIRAMVDYLQRRKSGELERAKLRIEHNKKIAELLFLGNKVYIINDNKSKQKKITKADLEKNGALMGMKNITLSQFEKALAKEKPAKIHLKSKTIDDLKTLFGKNMKILINQ